MTSTGRYRIFTGLIVVLGTLVFLSSTALASCPKGYRFHNGYCTRDLETETETGQLNCSGPCDECTDMQPARADQRGGPAGGCGHAATTKYAWFAREDRLP